MRRKQKDQIKKDLEKKMVFLVGPRQVGKTWLANEIAKEYESFAYLNYDHGDDRTIIKNEQWPPTTELLVFDELHKMPVWKNFLKGVYDTREPQQKILVTGSARLETFRQAGDSLAGRFFAHHLLPFSLSELSGTDSARNIDHLITRGGFPEPFLAAEDIDADRWRKQYVDGLIREDILDFERIADFRAMRNVLSFLRRGVGSPASYVSLAEDADISPTTARKYVDILEALYIVFRVAPYHTRIARSLRKEAKVYFFDTGLVVGDNGAKFENFVAVSLLKSVLGRNDALGEDNALRYIRTKEKKEVDFCLVNGDNEVETLIESKVTRKQLDPNLLYFSKKYNLKAMQIVRHLRQERVVENIPITGAQSFLSSLFL